MEGLLAYTNQKIESAFASKDLERVTKEAILESVSVKEWEEFYKKFVDHYRHLPYFNPDDV